MTKPILELAKISEKATAKVAETGRMTVQLISSGWGSSGYYSPQVLQEAATSVVIPAGTHMYADHPTAKEDKERPGRSIKDLMAITLEDARAVSEAGTTRLVADIDIVPGWRDTVETVRNHIGVSIRGSATDLTMGEAEGRKGKIVEGLAHVSSVDFVTRAGRGGKILQVAESAEREEQVLHRIDEATATDRSQHLRQAVRDAHGAEGTFVWLRDHDAEDNVVWFDINRDGRERTYEQKYSVDKNDVDIELEGEPMEVRGIRTYVPVKDPKATTENNPTDDPTPVGRTKKTTESEEDHKMGNAQIEESALKALQETADRVPVLEAERDTAIARGDQAEAREAARSIIAEAKDVRFSPLEIKGLLSELPLVEGKLDTKTFTTNIETVVKDLKEAAAKAAEDDGAGVVTSFGSTSKPTKGISESELNTRLGIVKTGA